MTLAAKVERIKWELAIDVSLPLSKAIATANEHMHLPPEGTLPEQVDRLLVVMGIALRSDQLGDEMTTAYQSSGKAERNSAETHGSPSDLPMTGPWQRTLRVTQGRPAGQFFHHDQMSAAATDSHIVISSLAASQQTITSLVTTKSKAFATTLANPAVDDFESAAATGTQNAFGQRIAAAKARAVQVSAKRDTTASLRFFSDTEQVAAQHPHRLAHGPATGTGNLSLSLLASPQCIEHSSVITPPAICATLSPDAFPSHDSYSPFLPPTPLLFERILISELIAMQGQVSLDMGLHFALKELSAKGLLESILMKVAPPRTSLGAPLHIPAFRRRSVDAAIEHLCTMDVSAELSCHESSEQVPKPEGAQRDQAALLLYGDDIFDRLVTAPDCRTHAMTLGVPHRVCILACPGDGVEHLLLRLHLYFCRTARNGLRVRAQCHCLMIGTYNVLAAAADAPRSIDAEPTATELAASPELIVRGIQALVDLLQAYMVDGVKESEDSSKGSGDLSKCSTGKIYVCHLLHVMNNMPWMTEVNQRIDAVNGLLSCKLKGANVIKTTMALQGDNYEADGISLSTLGYDKLVGQLTTLLPSLSASIKADALAAAKAAADDATAEMLKAQVAVAEARKAQRALLDTKLHLSRAKAETARADAAEATAAAHIAAIEYTYWSEAVAAARAQAAAEVLQASERARRARASGSENASTVSAAAAAAATKAQVRAAVRGTCTGLLHTDRGGQYQHQERFGLWTRKRCWAASLLQAFVRQRKHFSVCAPCDGSTESADAQRKVSVSGSDGACFRCGGQGHWARWCREARWIDASVACRTKLRLRVVCEQRVDEDGLIQTTAVVKGRLYVGPVAIRWPARVRLRVETGGHVSVDVTAYSRDAERDIQGKTRLCRFFDRFGACSRGEECTFAHGMSELTPEAAVDAAERDSIRSSSDALLPAGRKPMRREDLYGRYKTALCEQWMSNSECILGEACSFAHGQGELLAPKRGLCERVSSAPATPLVSHLRARRAA